MDDNYFYCWSFVHAPKTIDHFKQHGRNVVIAATRSILVSQSVSVSVSVSFCNTKLFLNAFDCCQHTDHGHFARRRIAVKGGVCNYGQAMLQQE